MFQYEKADVEQTVKRLFENDGFFTIGSAYIGHHYVRFDRFGKYCPRVTAVIDHKAEVTMYSKYETYKVFEYIEKMDRPKHRTQPSYDNVYDVEPIKTKEEAIGNLIGLGIGALAIFAANKLAK